MKTLDEVITGFDVCSNGKGCENCPYAVYDEDGFEQYLDCEKMETDALHYLKHLKDYYEISANGGLLTPEPRSAEIGSGVEIKWHEPNPPLTWGELLQMEGKPVWVEWSEVIIGDYFQFHGWFLVEWINDNENEIIMQNKYGKRMIRHENDNDWQAYRKERE